MQSVFDWSKKPKSSRILSRTRKSTEIPVDLLSKYSPRIQEELKKHIAKCTSAAVREHDIKNSLTLNLVKFGKLKINEFCLMCLKYEDKILINHPYFEGKLCQYCMIKYKPTVFAYDDDDGKSVSNLPKLSL